VDDPSAPAPAGRSGRSTACKARKSTRPGGGLDLLGDRMRVRIDARPQPSLVAAVTRLAYRHRGCDSLFPADAMLNPPEERHSHGLRRLDAIDQLGRERRELPLARSRLNTAFQESTAAPAPRR
jgi:hypothetical protein